MPLMNARMDAMRVTIIPSAFFLVSSISFSQPGNALVFAVATVRASQHPVGADTNNQFAFEAAGISGRNVTLRRLVAEAYSLQIQQVAAPGWADQKEYDLEARADGPASKEQLRLMLRALLSERFRLAAHEEEQERRVYELTTDKDGPKIRPITPFPETRPGLHLQGDMRAFANFLAFQLTIPVLDDPTQPGRASGPPPLVLDKTGLSGIYDFPVNVKPETESDMFVLWQRILRDQMGLRLASLKGRVMVLVVDWAEKEPAEN